MKSDDELEQDVIGSLMAEWLDQHPGATEDEAWDAICFKVLGRMDKEQSSERINTHA